MFELGERLCAELMSLREPRGLLQVHKFWITRAQFFLFCFYENKFINNKL